MTSFRNWTAPVLLAGLVAAGLAGAAQAATDRSEQAEASGVTQAEVSPVAAIRTAERKAGGRALGFGYESDAGTNAYEVTVASPHGLRMVQVDPASGRVLSDRSESKRALAEDGLPASALGAAEGARTPLADAVSAAEKAAGARSLEAGYAVHHGQLGIDVDIAAKGRIASWSVDPATGKASMAQASETEGQEGAENGEPAGDAD